MVLYAVSIGHPPGVVGVSGGVLAGEIKARIYLKIEPQEKWGRNHETEISTEPTAEV